MSIKMMVVMAVGVAMLGMSTLAQAGVCQQPVGYIQPRLLLFASMLA